MGLTPNLSIEATRNGKPLWAITVDHGTEFQSRALEDWAYRRGVQLDFIRPGKPIEDAFIESFNGRRPHGSLGYLTPTEFVARCQVMTTAEVAPV